MGRDRDVEAFDRRAASYEHGRLAAWHDRITATSAGIATRAAPGAQRIHDVGCGTGALLRTLADRLPAAIELVGVDPAAGMIAAARSAPALDPRIHFGAAAAERLPHPDASFDLVVSVTSFDHWADQGAGISRGGLRADARSAVRARRPLRALAAADGRAESATSRPNSSSSPAAARSGPSAAPALGTRRHPRLAPLRSSRRRSTLSGSRAQRARTSTDRTRLPAGALAVRAARPAAGPALAFLQLLLGPPNAARSSGHLLGILDPADELVAGQGRDVLPGIECRGVGDQRLAQVRGQFMHHPTGQPRAAHGFDGSEPGQVRFTIRWRPISASQHAGRLAPRAPTTAAGSSGRPRPSPAGFGAAVAQPGDERAFSARPLPPGHA